MLASYLGFLEINESITMDSKIIGVKTEVWLKASSGIKFQSNMLPLLRYALLIAAYCRNYPQ